MTCPTFIRQGISVANVPGSFSAVALAEHALMLMLCVAKNWTIAQRNARAGIFRQPLNEELAGRTLGMVGFGASAQELAGRARTMGMQIPAFDINVAEETYRERNVEYAGPRSDSLRLGLCFASRSADG